MKQEESPGPPPNFQPPPREAHPKHFHTVSMLLLFNGVLWKLAGWFTTTRRHTRGWVVL